MSYSVSRLQLLIHSILGIRGKWKDSRCWKKAQRVRRKTVKRLEVNCWAGEIKEVEKEICQSEKFLGCQQLSLGWVCLGEQMVESFWERIDGVKNCSSKELECSLGWTRCVNSVWLIKFKSLSYEDDDWILAFYLRILSHHFTRLSQHYHGEHQQSHQVFLVTIPYWPYLYGPSKQYWNTLHYTRAVVPKSYCSLNSQSPSNVSYFISKHNLLLMEKEDWKFASCMLPNHI